MPFLLEGFDFSQFIANTRAVSTHSRIWNKRCLMVHTLYQTTFPIEQIDGVVAQATSIVWARVQPSVYPCLGSEYKCCQIVLVIGNLKHQHTTHREGRAWQSGNFPWHGITYQLSKYCLSPGFGTLRMFSCVARPM